MIFQISWELRHSSEHTVCPNNFVFSDGTFQTVSMIATLWWGEFLKPNLLCVKKTNQKSRLTKVAIFTVEQKRFIVKAFSRNPSPDSMSRKFLLHFKIIGRYANKLHSHLFSTVNFVHDDSILRKKRTPACESPNWSPDKIKMFKLLFHWVQRHRWEEQHPSLKFLSHNEARS